MDDSCRVQEIIHVFSLVHKYVSRILGTYHFELRLFCPFGQAEASPFKILSMLLRAKSCAVSLKITEM